jgi:DNA-binding transcriptional LysR family regulator
MLDLNDFLYFVHIVDRGGFTPASRALGVPKSTLSHRIMQLESDLGVRLLNRTSRHVGLTNAGRDFYEHAAASLREAEMAETVVRQRLAEPCGVVRVTAALSIMHYALSDIIVDFLRCHPRIDVIANATDVNVDIVRENFDVAVRGHSGPLPDSGLIQRTLTTMNFHLYAGAAYLSEHGEPETPDDLERHAGLFMMRTAVPANWHLRHVRGGHDEVMVPLQPRLASDDVSALQKAAVAGLGIVALPTYVCREAVRSGALKLVLPDWAAGSGSMTALVPSRQGMLPSVRAFLDHLSVEVPKLASW